MGDEDIAEVNIPDRAASPMIQELADHLEQLHLNVNPTPALPAPQGPVIPVALAVPVIPAVPAIQAVPPPIIAPAPAPPILAAHQSNRQCQPANKNKEYQCTLDEEAQRREN